MPIVPFAVQSYKSESLPLAAQRLVNAYAEVQPQTGGAKAPTPVFGVPGILDQTTVGAGPIRGLWEMNERLYAVSGSALYLVNADGSNALLGSGIRIGTTPVSMSDNGSQVMVVDGLNGFVWDSVTSTFAQVASTAFYPTSTVTYFDGSFVFPRDGTNEFFASELLDGLSYNPLTFGSAEVNSDFVKAVQNVNEQLLVLGGKTIESWYDAGLSPFPYLRYNGGTIQFGILAPQASIIADNSLFFVANDRSFRRLQGSTPVRVSTYAIEQAWARYGTVSDAFCWTVTWAGHVWIVITFPTMMATWVYDATTELWHERESWDENNMSLGLWRAQCYAKCYGKHLVGDSQSNKIGMLDRDTYTEWGNTIRFLAQSPTLHNDRKRINMYSFELDCELGVGSLVTDPQWMLDYSDDGGRTYSPQQLWLSAGRSGDWGTDGGARLKWRQLGQFRQRIMRLQITEPVKRVIISAHSDVAVMNH